jgi:hypothetical protein
MLWRLYYGNQFPSFRRSDGCGWPSNLLSVYHFDNDPWKHPGCRDANTAAW